MAEASSGDLAGRAIMAEDGSPPWFTDEGTAGPPSLASPASSDNVDSADTDPDDKVAKRRRTADPGPPGPTGYGECLRFARHQVQAATSAAREWRHGPCSFGDRLAHRGLLVSTDYSGISCAEMACDMVKDRCNLSTGAP